MSYPAIKKKVEINKGLKIAAGYNRLPQVQNNLILRALIVNYYNPILTNVFAETFVPDIYIRYAFFCLGAIRQESAKRS